MILPENAPAHQTAPAIQGVSAGPPLQEGRAQGRRQHRESCIQSDSATVEHESDLTDQKHVSAVRQAACDLHADHWCYRAFPARALASEAKAAMDKGGARTSGMLANSSGRQMTLQRNGHMYIARQPRHSITMPERHLPVESMNYRESLKALAFRRGEAGKWVGCAAICIQHGSGQIYLRCTHAEHERRFVVG